MNGSLGYFSERSDIVGCSDSAKPAKVGLFDRNSTIEESLESLEPCWWSSFAPLERWDESCSEEFENQPLRESEDAMVITPDHPFDWFKAVYRDWVFEVCRCSAPDPSPLVCVDRRVRRRACRRRLPLGAVVQSDAPTPLETKGESPEPSVDVFRNGSKRGFIKRRMIRSIQRCAA